MVRLYWQSGILKEDRICEGNTLITVYDVKHREQEAHDCLKPNPIEIKSCKTRLNGKEAQIQVVPAIWLRNWQNTVKRGYRFHSYVVTKEETNKFYDIFSRSLQDDLASQNLILEGAFRTGSKDPQDGYHVRVDFQK